MSLTHTAFSLREEYDGTVPQHQEDPDAPLVQVPIFQGGVLAIPPGGRSYDIAEKLDDGDGVIVVESANDVLVEMLREYPALKEVAVPDGRVDSDVDGWTVAMLQEELARLTLPRSGNRPGLLERVKAARELLATGDVPPEALAQAVADRIATQEAPPA